MLRRDKSEQDFSPLILKADQNDLDGEINASPGPEAISKLPLDSTDDKSSLFEDNEHGATYSIDQAIEELGFGWLQIRLLVICGCWWGADAMEIMLLSFLNPILEREWELSWFWSASVAAATFVGAFVGTYIWGPVSDRYGRRIGFLLPISITSVFGLLSAAFANLYWLLAMRMLLGVGFGGTGVAFSMFSEVLPIKNRGTYLVAFEVFWTIGILFETLLAWLILPTIGWRWLLCITAVPVTLMLLCYPLLLESPRYLLATGQVQKAREVLNQIAKINGKSLPSGSLATTEIKEETGNMRDLMAPSLRRLTLLLWSLWFINAIVYYGNVLFTPGYFNRTLGDGENPSTYFYTVITTLSELPGLLFSGFLIDRVGRRLTMAAMLGLCGVCLLALLLEPASVVGLILLSGGRMAIEASYAGLWTFTPEAYPTTIRATGMGVANGWARIASILAPFISSSIIESSVVVPLVFFGSCALVGTGCAALLPFDTKERGMRETVSATSSPAVAGSPKTHSLHPSLHDLPIESLRDTSAVELDLVPKELSSEPDE